MLRELKLISSGLNTWFPLGSPRIRLRRGHRLWRKLLTQAPVRRHSAQRWQVDFRLRYPQPVTVSAVLSSSPSMPRQISPFWGGGARLGSSVPTCGGRSTYATNDIASLGDSYTPTMALLDGRSRCASPDRCCRARSARPFLCSRESDCPVVVPVLTSR